MEGEERGNRKERYNRGERERSIEEIDKRGRKSRREIYRERAV